MLASDFIAGSISDVTTAPIDKKLEAQLALCSGQPDRVLFLDIETTGLSHFYDEVTIVGWSFGGRASTLVKGQDHAALKRDAAAAVAVVTFNGIRFDARFLQREFPDIHLPKVHLDLMYLCRRIGLTGGQKKIEEALRLGFREGLSDVDGFAAVLLWHRYLRGDIAALGRLIRYNRCDIAAMGAIFDVVLSKLSSQLDLYSEVASFIDWSAPAGWANPPDNLPVPSSHRSSVHTFDSLFAGTSAETLRVIGIDLTGSEARPSGWCLLDGYIAETWLLSTDDEIIERTLSSNPQLVSIDSPLSLPAGRISVDDSDPGRHEFGIMRWSERELKRRGINVYPCLLPSMQKLTARGMRLADRLRSVGIPVIESYPGAAQDIMRIPRKGAGEEWLKLGLNEFGVLGSYTYEAVSHDELDAITSALVGTFHWIGRSEGLGTVEEPPLIVPKLDGDPHPTVVGISGPIAAGKTTLARKLEELGFAYTRFSQIIDDELRRQGEPLDREHRQQLGDEIHRSGRQRWLAEQTLAKVGAARLIVVDGLRFPEDHAFLAERAGGNFVHVHVAALEPLRRARYNSRSLDGEFDVASKSPVEAEITRLRRLAHRIFSNDARLSDLEDFAHELNAQLVRSSKCQSQL